jgi:2-phosphosulfolactate phosphatase
MKTSLWVDTAFSHTEVPLRLADTEKERGAAPGDIVCCVIDVLRATSTIAAAMGNGCAGFYPCASPDAARELAASLRAEHGNGNVLLGGEKDARPIEGFDGGNSPREYARERIGGRRLVFSSTNGTRTLDAVKDCRAVFTAAYANLTAVATRLADELEKGSALLIACSGREGGYTVEDTVVAGELISKLTPLVGEIDLSDTSAAALEISKAAEGDGAAMLRNCRWGRYLAGLGLGDDIDFCGRRDWTDIVPEMKDGVILPG